jgi:hypothetical protein
MAQIRFWMGIALRDMTFFPIVNILKYTLACATMYTWH